MIQCLKEGVLPSMPSFLALLIEHCNAEDVLDVSQLLNQLCAKFGPIAVPALDAAALPFLRKCHSLVTTISSSRNHHNDESSCNDSNNGNGGDGAAVPPHLLIEQLVIKKLTFLFLQNVVSHGATSLLLSSSNIQSLEDVLNTMNDGATSEIHDAVVKKSCVVFFRDLIDQWSGEEVGGSERESLSSPNIPRAGFLRFIYDVFLPSAMQCILQKTFNEKDAMHYRVICEVGKTLAALKLKRGHVEWEEQFVSRTLSGMVTTVVAPQPATCPSQSDVIAAFRNASNPKEMEICLKNMIAVLKNR